MDLNHFNEGKYRRPHRQKMNWIIPGSAYYDFVTDSDVHDGNYVAALTSSFFADVSYSLTGIVTETGSYTQQSGKFPPRYAWSREFYSHRSCDY